MASMSIALAVGGSPLARFANIARTDREKIIAGTQMRYPHNAQTSTSAVEFTMLV